VKVDRESSWFLVDTAVASAVVVLVFSLFDDRNIDMVLLLTVAAVVGVPIGNRIRGRRH